MLVYACTIFVSAFLLFQVQPIIAKMILPWFGGSAAVWTVCLLFFQVVLLLGYLYAYWCFRYLKPKNQAWLHVALLGLSTLFLPIIPSDAWKPFGGEDPTFRIMGLLGATIGLPYFLLSTTGPLLQAWFSRTVSTAVPYRLFALSNAGSMLALLSYPALIEPFFATRRQAQNWSMAYLGFVLLCGVVAVRLRWGAGTQGDGDIGRSGDLQTGPGWGLHLLWLALAACASSLLLAVTNYLTQNVAAIPFLWILPLTLYLLSFVICFEREGWYGRNPFLQLMGVALGGMAYALSEGFENTGLKLLIPLFATSLFVCCMVCHGELAKLKPDARYLTSFYLMCSLGGALGGIFVGLAAPHLFSAYFELQVSIASCAILVLIVLYRDPASSFYKARWQPAWLMYVALTIGLIGYLSIEIRESAKGARVRVRNFYGGLRVSDTGMPGSWTATRSLMHGTINHGEQFLHPVRSRQPTTYYGPNTGVGLTLRERMEPQHVGVIGLGTGTLAAYGRGGDRYCFYEINPLVIQLARSEFTFVRDCRAEVDIVLGDARLSLEREPKHGFDVLAVDAFSSDSIPIHLLTKEAFELYFRHLKEDGVLAVHISNRYLDLEPVVERLTEVLHKKALMVDTEDDDDNDVFGAAWILVSSRGTFFDSPAIKSVGTALRMRKDLRMWTDDYSNLFRILK